MSKTLTIGVVINDITNPFYSMVVKGAESEAKACGYSLILVSNENPETELHQLQMLHDKQVDGIIFGPTGTTPSSSAVACARFP